MSWFNGCDIEGEAAGSALSSPRGHAGIDERLRVTVRSSLGGSGGVVVCGESASLREGGDVVTGEERNAGESGSGAGGGGANELFRTADSERDGNGSSSSGNNNDDSSTDGSDSSPSLTPSTSDSASVTTTKGRRAGKTGADAAGAASVKTKTNEKGGEEGGRAGRGGGRGKLFGLKAAWLTRTAAAVGRGQTGSQEAKRKRRDEDQTEKGEDGDEGVASGSKPIGRASAGGEGGGAKRRRHDDTGGGYVASSPSTRRRGMFSSPRSMLRGRWRSPAADPWRKHAKTLKAVAEQEARSLLLRRARLRAQASTACGFRPVWVLSLRVGMVVLAMVGKLRSGGVAAVVEWQLWW